MLQRTGYASRSLIDGWGPDLLDIARAAFRRNAALDVTGVLYFDRLRFFQVLEGPPESVDLLMRDILADPRHGDVRVLVDAPARRRRWRGWALRVLDGDADPAMRSAFPAPLNAGAAAGFAEALAQRGA